MNAVVQLDGQTGDVAATTTSEEYEEGQEPFVFPYVEGRHDCAMNDTREANASGINIHGKRYTTVATRVEIFRRHFGPFGRLRIRDFSENEGVISMAAVVELRGKDGWELVAEGHAEEVRRSTGINSTSALEVCETSAYGRALANFGLAGGEFASANEVENAFAQQGKSFKDNSGRPDTSEVDQEQASAYAKTFADALRDGDTNVIYENQDRLKGLPELYQAVWNLLGSKQRTDLRAIIAARQK